MKKHFNLLFLFLTSFVFLLTGCPKDISSSTNQNTQEITEADTQIDGSTVGSNYAFIEYSLSDYNNQNVTISFTAQMKVENTGSKAENLMWQVNISSYPIIASHSFPVGTSDWVTVSGSKSDIQLGTDNALYLSTYQTEASKLKIYLKNVKLTVTEQEAPSEDDWLSDSTPSIKDTYADIFDSFGIACEYSPSGRGELSSTDVRKGLSKHADSITMGNEFKPQFIAAWWGSNPLVSGTFTASNGKTIDTPVLNGFGTVDNCLKACKDAGLVMRGHVLVWHSQTEEAFFRENYQTNGDLVDKETMTARQEWYIKTVLDHVADWEKANGYGEGNHIVWAWDVVNEAMADDAGTSYSGSSQDWLRGSTNNTKDKAPSNGGSRWYQIYESEEFIINAFRFANAYAPADVKLCYNDYNEYMGNKHKAILHIIDLLQNADTTKVNGKDVKPRIDVMGMQSHVSATWPEASSYESALKDFLNAGVDVHVTEFDIAATSQSTAASVYKEYFNMLKKYGKKYSGTNKITNVTVWGISSEDSWIRTNSNNETQYPLLFNRSGSYYYPNSSFDSIITAAE